MCEFLSGLTFGPKLEGKFGRCYADPSKTDHHTELEKALGLKDRHADPAWAKWEFTPGNDLFDFDSYKFRLDELRTPEWWTEDIQEETIRFARRKLAEVILTTGVHKLSDGRWWIGGDAEVTADGNATLEWVDGNATLKWVTGNATLKWVTGNATLERVDGNATLEWVDGNATLKWVTGNATLAVVTGPYATVILYSGELPAEIRDRAVVLDRRNINTPVIAAWTDVEVTPEVPE